MITTQWRPCLKRQKGGYTTERKTKSKIGGNGQNEADHNLQTEL